jgi:hypothetical protein
MAGTWPELEVAQQERYIYLYLLNILQKRYTTELRKIHGSQLEDPRLVPFNVDVMYATGGGSPHGRYVKISIVLL